MASDEEAHAAMTIEFRMNGTGTVTPPAAEAQDGDD